MREKDGAVLFVQADHLSGEVLGAAIEMLYQAGASNVNVVSSITKKNRPGYIIFIDCLPGALPNIEEVIVRELRVSGWHRIDTKHCYHNVGMLTKNVCVHIPGQDFSFLAEGKILDDDIENLRPESRSSLALKRELECRGTVIPLMEVERKLYQVLTHPEQPDIYFGKEMQKL